MTNLSKDWHSGYAGLLNDMYQEQVDLISNVEDQSSLSPIHNMQVDIKYLRDKVIKLEAQILLLQQCMETYTINQNSGVSQS